MIDVRSARRDDAEFIVNSQISMAGETEEMQLDHPVVQRGVNKVFDDPTKGTYYVAEVEGELGGCLLTISEWSDWRDGTVLWIHSLYVLPTFRRRGVFRAFYDHLRQIVERDDTLKGLRLYVDKQNAPARNVYRKLGMDDAHYVMFEWMK